MTAAMNEATSEATPDPMSTSADRAARRRSLGDMLLNRVQKNDRKREWARTNFAINGFNEPDHTVVRADVKSFIRDARHAGRTWDLVVCDPFSNSKRTDEAFDIEREQTPMMQALHQIVRPGGVLYYSTNFRKFSLNNETFSGYDATEISASTVPPDFRDRRIHRCWRALRRDR